MSEIIFDYQSKMEEEEEDEAEMLKLEM